MQTFMAVGLVALGLGRLKPGLIHSSRPAPDFSTFLLISNIIIYIPFLGVKAQSDAHYSSKKKDNFPPRQS